MGRPGEMLRRMDIGENEPSQNGHFGSLKLQEIGYHASHAHRKPNGMYTAQQNTTLRVSARFNTTNGTSVVIYPSTSVTLMAAPRIVRLDDGGL
jgi:hypothetical protein